MRKKLIALVAALALIVGTIPVMAMTIANGKSVDSALRPNTTSWNERVYTAKEQELLLEVQEALRESIDYMLDPKRDYYPAAGLSFGTNYGEWAAVAIGRSYVAVNQQVFTLYEKNAKAYIQSKITDNIIDSSKITENQRGIVGFAAVNIDPTKVEGSNLVAGLNQMNLFRRQGLNALYWALIALDTKGYETSGDVTREKLIEEILGAEIKVSSDTLEQGGWALTGDVPDPDMTAMAIQALAPYYKQDYMTQSGKKVVDYVDRALLVMDKRQLDDGDFGSWGSQNSESTAWIINALCAIGQDPLRCYDAKGNQLFISNTGKTLYEGLLKYRVETGGFYHVILPNAAGANAMGTDQAAYTLAGILRFVTGQVNLFDYSDAGKAHSIVAAETDHGTVTVSKQKAAQGETVKVTVQPEDGYRLVEGSLRYTQQEGNIRFGEDGKIIFENQAADFSHSIDPENAAFIMPNNELILTAEFEKIPLDGDANGDGLINGDDMLIVLNHMGETVDKGTNGDVNRDGLVNGDDILLVLNHFEKG